VTAHLRAWIALAAVCRRLARAVLALAGLAGAACVPVAIVLLYLG
jgi:hypothetical protein